MAIKDIIGPGIGFSPGGITYLITSGFSIGAAAAQAYGQPLEWSAKQRSHDWSVKDRNTEWAADQRRSEWGVG